MQDVKDEGPASGMTRDEVIETNERLRAVRIRLEDSYDTAKKSLVTLMNQYGDSKTHKNMFHRYPLLKLMIKVYTIWHLNLTIMIFGYLYDWFNLHQDVIKLETEYWTLVDIPKQEKQETVPSYVMRACSIMEKTQKSGEGVKTAAKLAEETSERKDRMERLESECCFPVELIS